MLQLGIRLEGNKLDMGRNKLQRLAPKHESFLNLGGRFQAQMRCCRFS